MYKTLQLPILVFIFFISSTFDAFLLLQNTSSHVSHPTNSTSVCPLFQTTKMDSKYFSRLYGYCDEIDAQQNALLHIKARHLPRPVFLLHHLQPTIDLLKKLKTLLHRLIHLHERDTVRKLRFDFQSRNSHLGVVIDTNWCCVCRCTLCIYD